ncbi:hypothetical protein [Acuticoccus sp.]|uniref:hypothetical protein n=1 Tax=Acuticoccus sp. TaxID=1904378 RepID=UPI003B51E099
MPRHAMTPHGGERRADAGDAHACALQAAYDAGVRDGEARATWFLLIGVLFGALNILLVV